MWEFCWERLAWGSGSVALSKLVINLYVTGSDSRMRQEVIMHAHALLKKMQGKPTYEKGGILLGEIGIEGGGSVALCTGDQSVCDWVG